MKITRIKATPLPVRTDIPGDVYRVTHLTARAIINPAPGEIRIPYVARQDKGDFKKLMNQLVSETGTNQIRFVNVDAEENAYSKVLETLSPPDARPLREVVSGFHVEKEMWDDQEVNCLVGTWNHESP